MKTKIAKWLLLQIMLIFSQDLLAGPVCRCGAVMVWVQERGGYLCEACNNAFIPGYQGASAEVSQIEVVQEEEQEEEVVQKKSGAGRKPVGDLHDLSYQVLPDAPGRRPDQYQRTDSPGLL